MQGDKVAKLLSLELSAYCAFKARPSPLLPAFSSPLPVTPLGCPFWSPV